MGIVVACVHEATPRRARVITGVGERLDSVRAAFAWREERRREESRRT